MNRHFAAGAVERASSRDRAGAAAAETKAAKMFQRFGRHWRCQKNPAAPQPDFYLSNDVASGEAGRRQHVALPQRATPIFSLRLSMPTAPITTCLPIT